ncbi:MAG: hypothetical protein LBS89_04530, partial [Zoogloeaceae bacterium]|nr:hypothetical protein [Zoogloeaceae bacterium]
MDDVQGWLAQVTGGGAKVTLALYVSLVVCAVVVFNFILRRALGKLEEKTRHMKTSLDFALVLAIRRPGTMLAWIVGLAFAAEIAGNETGIA